MNEHLDHIIWACSDLEHGVRRFEALTGATPKFGGVHASGLTHNALVRIGQRSYLEVLAPTGAERPDEDAWCKIARASREPRVMTFCMRSPRPLEDIAAIGATRGWRDSRVEKNGRITPEGVSLRWRWISPKIDALGVSFPFFIDWLDSPHPAEMLAVRTQPDPIRLHRFAVGHPDGATLGETLWELGSPVEAYVGASEFRVELETPKGLVSL